MNERFSWKVKRIGNGIKLKEIAAHLKVTSSHVCMFEGNKCEMAPDKVRKYKQFIEERLTKGE